MAFLADLAARVDVLPRNQWTQEKTKLLKILSRRLDLSEAEMVFKSYLLCLDPQKIAERLAPRQLHEFSSAVRKFLQCDEYVQEVSLGRLRCDLIGIKSGSTLAVEIKSARDNVANALRQVKYYKLWAKEVYLAYDSRHSNRVDKLPFREVGIGLLEVSDSGVELKSRPSQNSANAKILLSLFPNKYLRETAKLHKVSTTGRKKELVDSLSIVLNQNELDRLLVSYVRDRVDISREKATIEYDQT